MMEIHHGDNERTVFERIPRNMYFCILMFFSLFQRREKLAQIMTEELKRKEKDFFESIEAEISDLLAQEV